MFRHTGLSTLVGLFQQTGQVGEWQVIWCLKRHQIILDVGSLCISTMWLFNFFLTDQTLKEELQGKETNDEKDQGEFNHHGLLHHQAEYIIVTDDLNCTKW